MYYWENKLGSVAWINLVMRSQSAYIFSKRANWCLPIIPITAIQFAQHPEQQIAILVVAIFASLFAFAMVLRHIHSLNFLWQIRPISMVDGTHIPEDELREFLLRNNSPWRLLVPIVITILTSAVMLRPIVQTWIAN